MLERSVVFSKLAEIRQRHSHAAGPHADESTKLNATLTEEELVEIEMRYGIRLPEDYRAFLRDISNGGLVGMFAWGQIDDGFEFTSWEGGHQNPAVPFPHLEAWNDISLWESDDPNAYYLGAGTHLGAVPLCHLGCALRDYLIVNGPCAGEVWLDGSAEGSGVQPYIKSDGTRFTFTDWLLTYLDQEVARLSCIHAGGHEPA